MHDSVVHRDQIAQHASSKTTDTMMNHISDLLWHVACDTWHVFFMVAALDSLT